MMKEDNGMLLIHTLVMKIKPSLLLIKCKLC